MTIIFQAGETELRVVQAVSMTTVTFISVVLALTVDTIAGIYILTADIVYVTLFPQLTCAIFVPFANPYGSFMGFVLGLILRFGGGEPSLSLAPFIKYPYYEEGTGQLFPYKTFAMICSLIVIIGVSFLFKVLFGSETSILPAEWDISGKVRVKAEAEEFSASKHLTENSEEKRPNVNDYLPVEPASCTASSDILMVKF